MILFYPNKLKGYARVKVLCDRGHIPYTENMDDGFTIVFNHDYNVVRNNRVIDRLAESYPVINGQLKDVTKENVSRVHKDVFGYNADIDPENYTERYIRKTNRQGDKSGQVFDAPQKAEAGFVYQRLINNVINGTRVEYRTYVIDGEIVWIREKWKKFLIHPELLMSRPMPDAFSVEQRRKILEFCLVIGLDYGELDILKEKDTIYIVDVNDIPGIRRDEVQQPGYDEELKRLTERFKDYVDRLEKQNKRA